MHRLFLDAAGWESLPKKLADPFFAARAADNRRALAVLRRHEPDRAPRRLDRPDGPPADIPWRVLKQRLQRSAVAWWLERRDEDLADVRLVVDRLLAFGWEPEYAGCGARLADLKTGDLAYCAAFALDVLGAHLAAGQEAALRRRLAEELLPAYLQAVADDEWWVRCVHNWNPAVHGNSGLAALALEDSHPDLARRVLAAATHHLRFAIGDLPAGGGYIEGAMYQCTLLGHLTDFIAALHRATGDDLGLLSEPRLHEAFAHRPDLVAPDGRPYNFSDVDEGTCELALPQTYWWAARLGRPQWTGWEDAHPKPWWDAHGLFHDVEAFWFRPTNPPSEPPPPRRLHRFSGLGWLAWRGEGAWLALRGGQLGGNHGNWDLGQVIFGVGNERWLIDPGYGAVATAQHNAVTIRGRDQADGARAPLLRLRDEPGRLHLALDLRECYPFVLDRHVRHLLLLDGRCLVVVDDLLAGGGRNLTARCHWQVRGEVAAEAQGAVIRHGAASARLHSYDRIFDLRVAEAVCHGEAYRTVSWRPWSDQPAAVLAACLAVGAPPPPLARDGRRLRLGDRVLDLDLLDLLPG